MGNLQHHQPAIQDLLQIKLDQSVEEYPQRCSGISGRHARSKRLSHGTPGNIQILHWSHKLPRRELRGGEPAHPTNHHLQPNPPLVGETAHRGLATLSQGCDPQ
jgi:hypothetical protein